MRKTVFRVLFALVLLLLLGLLWYGRQQAQAPQVVTPATPEAAQPAPAAQPVLQPELASPAPKEPAAPPPSEPPQPLALDIPDDPVAANALMGKLLVEIVERKSIREFMQIDDFARRVVATVDSLPRGHSSWTIWPVNRTAGRFTVVPGSTPNEGILSATNAARYTGFVEMVESVSADKWVTLYIQVYPLLQRAYADLGYPDASFHQRLLEVIDHLLATPVLTSAPTLHLVEVRGPVASTQPWVRYEYKDQVLEAMSAGQKMLMRMGAANHQKLRMKLTALRVELAVRAKHVDARAKP